jgi:hypothetical protein
MAALEWAEVCRFYDSVCSKLWGPLTFHPIDQLSSNFGCVPNFQNSLDAINIFFPKNVSISPSGKKHEVIWPLVMSHMAQSYGTKLNTQILETVSPQA